MSRSHLFSWKLSRPGKVVRRLAAAAVSAALLVSATAHGEINLKPIGAYATGQFDESAAEIPAFDPQTDRLFVVNANKGEVDVLDLSDPTNPSLLFSIEAKDPNADEVNSVAVSNGLVALAVAHDDTGQNGWVEVYNSNLDDGDAPIATYTAGALPDMVTFSPDGSKILAANEGETDGEDNDPRDSEFTVNPEGSVTVIDITSGAANGVVTQIGFTAFNGQEAALRDSGVLIWPGDESSSPNSFSTDAEPEYIAVSPDGSTAFVALQENNAVAKIDLTNNTVTEIQPLGFKDHSVAGNEIDASDRDDGVNIRNWPIFGMYMPDAIATYEVDGTTYYVTANEGDARGDDGVEVERLKKIDDFDLELDETVFPDRDDLLEDEQLGRIEVRFVRGDTDDDGALEEIYVYGGRSFSIYDENGNQVFDSGSQFEQLTAGFLPPETFNSNNDENDSFESRSDAKGPEPEGVTIAEFGGRILAFILLERVGGVMVYDISQPTQAEFVTYVNNRDFDPDLDAEDQLELVGDLGPEGAVFVDPADSPNGQALLIVANEVSGTTTIYQVEENYFPQSVASGDPRPDSVILWTRVSDPDADGDVTGIQLEVATDESFNNIVATRNDLVAEADHDHCIKTRVDGLSPYTTYYYRFLYKSTATNTGRTRTAPAPGSDVALSFAHLNCQDYVGRYYNTLVDLVQTHPDLDFIVHVGDYIYETTGDPQFQNNSDVRGINFTDGQAIDLGGFAAANSLQNYRTIYKTYREDPALQRVHELYPFITIWDDHEFSDDHWQTNATFTDGLEDENQPARKRNAEQAWFEFVPSDFGINGSNTGLGFDIDVISPTQGSSPATIYGSFDFGSNLSIFLSDSRSYRPDHLIPEDAFPGTVIASAANLSLPEILDPFVNFENDLDPTQQATLQGIVNALAQGAGLSAPDAAAYVAANLTGDLSVTYLNALFDGAGQAALAIDPAGKPTGLTFLSMGKQDLFSDIGSRYGVVQNLYEIYAALPGTDQNVLGDTQLAEFQSWIQTSTAGCNIFASSVSFTPTVLDLSAGFDILPPEFQQKISLNMEHWAGFPAQRQVVIDELAQNNGLIISGDIHASFVSEHGNTSGDATVPEFTGTSVSSESFQEVVEGVANGLLGEGQEAIVQGLLAGLDALLQGGALATPSYNSVIVEAETRVNGYVVTQVDSNGLVATNHHVDTDEVENNYYEQPGVAAADLPEFTRQAYQVEVGGDDKGEITDLFTLQILHASDLEGGVDALDRAPVFGSLVERFENQMPNTIVLSAGDNFIPGPFYNAAGDRATFRDSGLFNDIYNDLFDPEDDYESLREGGGRVDITIMNLIGFDASAVGNHEFDNGPDAFESIIEEDFDDNDGTEDDRWVGAQFPYLSANLDFSGDGDLGNLFTSDILFNTEFVTGPEQSDAGDSGVPKLAPSTVIEVNGELVGVVGATTQLVETISSTGGVTETTSPGVEDMPALAAALQPVINDLLSFQDGINKLVLVTHLQQIALEKELLGLLEGVDVIIAGGSDTLQANPSDILNPGDIAEEPYPYQGVNKDGDPALIVSTAGEYSYLGRLVVNFDDQGILKGFDGDRSGPYATEAPQLVSALGIDDVNNDQEVDYEDLKALTSVDEPVQDLVDAVFEVIIAKDSNIIGFTTVFLEGRRENVRTQETNLGNLTADANLWIAKFFDPGTMVSIKNAGGIRAAIGEVQKQPPYDLLPPQANPLSGKEDGEISQLDIENSLRFNNSLTLLTVSLEQLIELLEHGVAASGPGNTPGQFPQVSGVRFSYDVNLPAGNRVKDVILMNGNTPELIYEDFGFIDPVDPQRNIRLVTLGFLADGGDGYPFPSGPAANRVDLDNAGAFGPDNTSFSAPGTEQDALAEYLATNFATEFDPFTQPETAPEMDRRIMNVDELPGDSLLYDPATRGGSLAYNTTVMYDPGQDFPALIISGLTPDFEVQGGIYDPETGNWIIYDYNAGRNIQISGISEGPSREMVPVDLLILLYRDTLQPPPVPPVVTVEYGMPAPELILGAPRQIELAKFRAEATGPDDPLNVTMELDTEPGKQYVISYTSDLGELNPASGEIGTLLAPVGEQITPPFTAGANRFQWTDTGPPYTYSEGPSQRFYLNYREVLEIRDDRN